MPIPDRVTYNPCPICGIDARVEHWPSKRFYINCTNDNCGSNGGTNFSAVTPLAIRSEQVTPCHRVVTSESGPLLIHYVRLLDGYLVDCGPNEARAAELAAVINSRAQLA